VIGSGALVAYGPNASNTASDVTTAITKLGIAAVGRGAPSPGSPAIVAQAIASVPVQPSRKAVEKKARQPTATTPASTTQPSTPGTATGAQNGPDPSGQNPPATLSGFTLQYVQEFDGDSIPAGWDTYSGVPGGESAQVAQWVPSMCTFSGGEAHFMASGIDSCGLQDYSTPQEYGAWFARVKGDDEPSGMSFSDIFLLWPADNQWPPEIDIYEDSGQSRSGTQASVHNTAGSLCGSSPTAQCLATYEQSNGPSGGVPNDGTGWHTYGVEWTPSGVTWLIDGRVIFTAPASEVKSPAQQPALPMYMDLQSQNLQGAGTPSGRETMTVDWAEQFSWNG
jgi:beta-glucanase (GH16 family)